VGRARIPAELKRTPFTLGEARRLGLTHRALEGKSWRRIGPSMYCWAGLSVDRLQLLRLWHRRLPDAVFVGKTAAWLHGMDVEPIQPVEVAVSGTSGIRSRPGLIVRRSDVAVRHAVTVRGLPASPFEATLLGLCRRLPAVEALVLLDGAMRTHLLTDRSAFGRLGLLAEPAESPMETRLRWLLIEAGLPRPEVQRDLRDAEGHFVGRADLYYDVTRLVIEYDGGNHRDRLIEDDRRQNAIVNAGYRVLRFTAGDVLQRPDALISQVRRALLPGRASGTVPPAAAASG
jgi:8-oxo-dGTP pyrophosphatase MutT (NUDIX family)